MPFSIVEGKGFVSLMKQAAPLYKVPSRNTIKNQVDVKYESASTALKQILNNVQSITITTYTWIADMQTKSFLGVTIQLIFDLKLISCTTGVTELTGSHTAAYIGSQLIEILNTWGINLEMVVAVVTDNAANIFKAVYDKFEKVKHVPCFAHTLNLLCENSIKNTQEWIIFIFDSDVVTSDKEEFFDLWAYHKKIAHTKKRNVASDVSADEVTQYLSVPVKSLMEDPLELWGELKNVYPNLYKMAIKYFCVVATSVPSERLCSKAGLTALKSRNRIDKEEEVGTALEKIEGKTQYLDYYYSMASTSQMGGVPPVSLDYFDLGKVDVSTLDNNEKRKILSTAMVLKSHKYPISIINSSGHQKSLKFQATWIDRWPWLAYSKISDGVFCKICLLFSREWAGKGSHQTLGIFVNVPFKKWKKATEKFENHAKTNYHKECVILADNYMKVTSGQVFDVVSQLNSKLQQEREENRSILKPIIKAVLFCGQQELPLRGDEDSGPLNLENPEKKDGKFRALLRFTANGGNDSYSLKKHFTSSNKNATYVSPIIQNEILDIAASLIRKKLIEKINKFGYFAILVDETMDVSGVEQMSFCVRYLSEENAKPIIREDFLSFVPVSDQSAESLCNLVLEECRKMNLDMNKCVGQGYDGAANMAGHVSGLQTRIRQLYPKAIYVHCASHRLNLALSKALSLPAARNCLGVVNEVSNFFRNNSRANHILKQQITELLPESKKTRLIRLCETRFIERHDSILVFVELLKPIVSALQIISNETRDTSSKAIMFLATIEKSEFIVSLLVCEKFLSFTLPLSKYLQSPSHDLVSALDQANDVIASLQKTRDNGESIFKQLFNTASKLLEELFGSELKIPRLTGRQSHRANPITNSTEEYFKVAIFLPCADQLIVNLQDRFGTPTTVLSAFQALLPGFASPDKATQLQTLSIFFIEKCSVSALQGEYYIWCNQISKEPNLETLGVLEICNKNFFPIIHHLLTILSTLPVTTATVERSFSTMKRVKTFLRNKMQHERLNSLAVLSIHWDVDVSVDSIINVMANKKNRRLVL
ncbi:unnamed protein product [Psylliodes chrysocephalus]|uniref:TTF-type domain-containing protein n=1 Tax=Psylliodes chrysocephalus TaxID=3402493 RepID=A0A9P0G998_9CUCU|nr:unnamed protein product [Psylliodes chrysocephala]